MAGKDAWSVVQVHRELRAMFADEEFPAALRDDMARILAEEMAAVERQTLADVFRGYVASEGVTVCTACRREVVDPGDPLAGGPCAEYSCGACYLIPESEREWCPGSYQTVTDSEVSEYPCGVCGKWWSVERLAFGGSHLVAHERKRLDLPRSSGERGRSSAAEGDACPSS